MHVVVDRGASYLCVQTIKTIKPAKAVLRLEIGVLGKRLIP